MIHRLRALGRRKFVRDTLWLQIATLVQSLTYMVTSLLTANMLGPRDLGRWSTSREMYMLVFFLVSLGMTNAAVSRYSQAKGRQDHEGSVFALAALLKLGSFVVVFIALLGVFVTPFAAERIYHDRELGIVARVLCFATAGEVCRSLALAVLNGTRQMRRYATLDVATNVFRMGLVGGALFMSATPMAVAWAFLAHGIVSALLAIVAYRSARRLGGTLAPPPLREVLVAVPRAPLRDFLGLSSLLALNKSMNAIVPRLGILFIPALASVKEHGFVDNGSYTVGTVLNLVLISGIGAVATNVLPTLGLTMARSDTPIEAMGPTLRRVTLTAGGLGMLAAAVSVPLAWLVIRYGYGEAYMAAFDTYLWLTAGTALLGFQVVVESFFIYANRVRLHVAMSLVIAVVTILGIYSATLAFGSKGAAAASGLARVVGLFHLVYIVWYFRRVRARGRLERAMETSSDTRTHE